MKLTLPSALALAGVSALLAAQTLQPLNARTGQWNITETINYANIPAQWASMMPNHHVVKYTSCVKPEDLNSNPFGDPGDKCKWTVVKSTGTDMEVRGTGCQFDSQNGGSVHGTIHMQDAQDGTGSMEFSATIQGMSISGHSDFTGTWASPSCSAGNE